MKLQIKKPSGKYIAVISHYGFTGSCYSFYEVTEFRFLWFKFESKKLIGKYTSARSYRDSVILGPSQLRSSAEYYIDKHERAKKDWAREGINL